MHKEMLRTVSLRKIGVTALITMLLIVAGYSAVTAADRDNGVKLLQTPKPTADHSKFKQLKGSLQSGPEVTGECLACHTEAAKQVQETIHWKWEKRDGNKVVMGKAHILNNF